MAEVADTPGSLEPQARHIVYCGVCTLPPEYCEFGGTAKKCEEWLEAKQPDLWTRLYSEGELHPSHLIQLYTASASASVSAYPDTPTIINSSRSTPIFITTPLPHPLTPKQSHLTPPPDAVTANLSTLSLSAQERAAKDAAKKEARAAQSEARDAERKAASKIQIKRVERNKRKHVTVLVGLEVFGLENKKIAKDLGKKFATGSSMTRSAAGTEEITVQGDVSEEIREWLLEVHGDKVPKGNIELIEDKKKKKADAAAGLA
ncbi:unnamed protein product [Penicillium manginii]